MMVLVFIVSVAAAALCTDEAARIMQDLQSDLDLKEHQALDQAQLARLLVEIVTKTARLGWVRKLAMASKLKTLETCQIDKPEL